MAGMTGLTGWIMRGNNMVCRSGSGDVATGLTAKRASGALPACGGSWRGRKDFAHKHLLQPGAPKSDVFVCFQGLVQSIFSMHSHSHSLDDITPLSPILLLFQVRAAAVHSVLHPRSDDDYSLWSDFQRALPRHSVRAGPEHRELWWGPAKVQTKHQQAF